MLGIKNAYAKRRLETTHAKKRDFTDHKWFTQNVILAGSLFAILKYNQSSISGAATMSRSTLGYSWSVTSNTV